jgi:hypothetical protein
MIDLWLLAMLVGFFVLTAGFVRLAEKLCSKEVPR